MDVQSLFSQNTRHLLLATIREPRVSEGILQALDDFSIELFLWFRIDDDVVTELLNVHFAVFLERGIQAVVGILLDYAVDDDHSTLFVETLFVFVFLKPF